MSDADSSVFPHGRRRKLAQNQAIFREINERIHELDQRLLPNRDLELICECSDTSCTTEVRLPAAEYERIRANPARFLIYPGHEVREIENVVKETAGYAVVEKLDDAADLVAALDPRTSHADGSQHALLGDASPSTHP